MRPFVLFPLWFGLLSAPCMAQSDTEHLHVEVHMDADGFMCPFLTPMFLDVLEDKGAVWSLRDVEEGTIEFCLPLGSAPSPEGLADWLVQLGYEERHIRFPVFDTLPEPLPHPSP